MCFDLLSSGFLTRFIGEIPALFLLLQLKCCTPPLTRMPKEPEWYCSKCILHSPARIRHGNRTPTQHSQQRRSLFTFSHTCPEVRIASNKLPPLNRAESVSAEDSDDKSSKNKKRKRNSSKAQPGKAAKLSNGSRGQQESSKGKNKHGKPGGGRRSSNKSSKPDKEAEPKKQRRRQSKKSSQNGQDDDDDGLYTVVVPVTTEVS